jgi:flagellar assembly factor FliW
MASFFETKNFGRLDYAPESAIEFPRGLPGFEERRLFLAIQLEQTNPLVFLQSLEDPDLCFITAPVLAVDPQYRLTMSDEDMGLIGFGGGPTPRMGEEALCLAVISCYETGPTANLLAPLVIHVRTLKAVQAVAQAPGYSHRHVLGEPREAALCS